ncbi:MAG: SAM-dependent methyltransferase [Anaerolineales bacterium]|nr:class I SAM-dependent methyltransferase [Anaerolineae bacterium]PWB53594.1 MAG: SAM-dependent methyltransferase [Anaerolineales bacterium]
MDVSSINRKRWDKQVELGNPWTIPCSPEIIAAARQGEWSVLLTEQKPVPRRWFPDDLRGLDILCLASGGGQQGPIFASLGANVTVFDLSPRQLEQDRMVARREGLKLVTVEGDMRDLSAFGNECFDLILHPVSNVFCPEVLPVWREAFRVLRKGGVLLAGFDNPCNFIFDFPKAEQGVFEVKYSLPYDATRLTEEQRQREFGEDSPLEFSHSLEEQIGGQLQAGFRLLDIYEDGQNSPLGKFMPGYIATRAVKPSS